MSTQRWRVGEHYSIHVYEGDRPVATFLTAEDARRAVDAVNGVGQAPAVAELTARLAKAEQANANLAKAWERNYELAKERYQMAELEVSYLKSVTE